MSEQEKTQQSETEGIPRNPRINYAFEKEEFDFFFQWIAGSQTGGGYNVPFVDLPGQGLLPAEGMPIRSDSEVPFSSVVDYALSRSDVNPDQLVTYGISGGGYLVPRALTVEDRLQACAA